MLVREKWIMKESFAMYLNQIGRKTYRTLNSLQSWFPNSQLNSTDSYKKTNLFYNGEKHVCTYNKSTDISRSAIDWHRKHVIWFFWYFSFQTCTNGFNEIRLRLPLVASGLQFRADLNCTKCIALSDEEPFANKFDK